MLLADKTDLLRSPFKTGALSTHLQEAMGGPSGARLTQRHPQQDHCWHLEQDNPAAHGTVPLAACASPPSQYPQQGRTPPPVGKHCICPVLVPTPCLLGTRLLLTLGGFVDVPFSHSDSSSEAGKHLLSG